MAEARKTLFLEAVPRESAEIPRARVVSAKAGMSYVVFATWRPVRVLLGALLFGGVTMLQFHLQGLGVGVPSPLLAMTPYLATIVVLALISRNPRWIRLNMPASLGRTFSPDA